MTRFEEAAKQAEKLKAADPVINKRQAAAIRESLELVGIAESALLAKTKTESVEAIKAADFERSMNWINRHADKEAS